ncbi:hypothetical protein MMC34_007504 [Xylographa carneopallida]|nr:hypothetical protein [Xylographa carneopallida]
MDFPPERRKYFQRRAAYFADFPGYRDLTASPHSSDYGYRGPQRYKTPDPPSHSDLTTPSSGGSGNSRAPSLVRQIIARVDQYLGNVESRYNPNDPAAVVGRHSATQVRAAAVNVAVGSDATVSALFSSPAADNMAAGTVGPGTAGPAVTTATTSHKYPVPRADSPNPFHSLPSTKTTATAQQPLTAHPNPFLAQKDTAPQIQPWIPINTPEGEKVLKEKNLPGLTGTLYEEKKPRSTHSSRWSSSRPGSRPKSSRQPYASSSSTVVTPFPLRKAVITSATASEPSPFGPTDLNPFGPATSSVPNPFAPGTPAPPVLSSHPLPGLTSLTPQQQPPPVTLSPATRTQRRRGGAAAVGSATAKPAQQPQRAKQARPKQKARSQAPSPQVLPKQLPKQSPPRQSSPQQPPPQKSPPQQPLPQAASAQAIPSTAASTTTIPPNSSVQKPPPQPPPPQQPHPTPPAQGAFTFFVHGKPVLHGSGTTLTQNILTMTRGSGYSITTVGAVTAGGGVMASMEFGGSAGTGGAPGP